MLYLTENGWCPIFYSRFLIFVIIFTISLTLHAQDSCRVISPQDIYSQNQIERLYFTPNERPNFAQIEANEKAQVLIDQVSLKLLETDLGKTLMKYSSVCHSDLIRQSMGFSGRHIFAHLLRQCPQHIPLKIPMKDSLSCLQSGSLMPRSFKVLNLPDVKMHSWTDKNNRTFLNLTSQEMTEEILGGRLYHEMYIQKDADFINQKNLDSSDYMQTPLFLALQKIDPILTAPESIRTLANPVLQASLASMRAFVAEHEERDTLTRLFGPKAAINEDYISKIASEDGCLAALEEITSVLEGGSCGIHRALDTDATTFGYSASYPYQYVTRSRSDLSKQLKDALKLFRTISSLGKVKGVDFCRESTRPRVQLSCAIVSVGPSPRIGGGSGK